MRLSLAKSSSLHGRPTVIIQLLCIKTDQSGALLRFLRHAADILRSCLRFSTLDDISTLMRRAMAIIGFAQAPSQRDVGRVANNPQHRRRAWIESHDARSHSLFKNFMQSILEVTGRMYVRDFSETPA